MQNIQDNKQYHCVHCRSSSSGPITVLYYCCCWGSCLSPTVLYYSPLVHWPIRPITILHAYGFVLLTYCLVTFLVSLATCPLSSTIVPCHFPVTQGQVCNIWQVAWDGTEHWTGGKQHEPPAMVSTIFASTASSMWDTLTIILSGMSKLQTVQSVPYGH